LSVNSHVVEAVTVITATGDIDMGAAPRLIEALREAAENADRALVVDLTPVTFLASAGMSALVFACGRAVSDSRLLLPGR
jgi:anti-sigma B factor antagonist